jgi:hypothetical protein
MGLYPVEIHDDPSVGGHPRALIVWEGFNPDDTGEEHCTTIVAVVNGERGSAPDLADYTNVYDWTAYMSAFSADTPQDERIRHCRQRGNKLDEEVAKAIFPRLSQYRFRR